MPPKIVILHGIVPMVTSTSVIPNWTPIYDKRGTKNLTKMQKLLNRFGASLLTKVDCYIFTDVITFDMLWFKHTALLECFTIDWLFGLEKERFPKVSQLIYKFEINLHNELNSKRTWIIIETLTGHLLKISPNNLGKDDINYQYRKWWALIIMMWKCDPLYYFWEKTDAITWL